MLTALRRIGIVLLLLLLAMIISVIAYLVAGAVADSDSPVSGVGAPDPHEIPAAYLTVM